jgi:hypothetical protein
VARETLGEIDQLVRALREDDTSEETGATVEPPPGLAALDTLAERHRSAGLAVSVRTRGPQRPLPPGLDQAAYRILQEALARPGDVAVVAPGTPHRFWNGGDGEARFLCEVRPALQLESLIETMFTLAVEGKTNRKGLPNPLRLAVIARAHFDTVRLPFPPALLQRAALAVGAPIGRLLRYPETVTRQRPLAASSC